MERENLNLPSQEKSRDRQNGDEAPVDVLSLPNTVHDQPALVVQDASLVDGKPSEDMTKFEMDLVLSYSRSLGGWYIVGCK